MSAPSGIYDTIQIEKGSEATSYEPYTGQSVQIPYTLNAIPVTSGGNVTIDGQQYIADYVDGERGKLVKMVDSSKLDNTQSIVNKTEWLLAEPQETDLTKEEITAFKALATYYPVTNISVNSEQLDGYTVFNYLTPFEDEWNKTQKEIGSLKTETGSLKEDVDEKGTALTDIQKKMSDSNSNDGFLLCDLNGNIVGHIASFEVWNNEPYNKKYGWGGHPYGNGKLPPYSKIAGVLEADLLSVRGGKGRWNKDDTGNFQHGGHLFEGWNAEEDARLTFGIGTKNKDISWIQTFHPATQEGTDSGSYYCVTKVGSDIDNQGVNFMPSITQSRSLFSLKVGNNLLPNSKHIQELVETGELVDWEYNKTDMVLYGTMYFDYDKDKVRVYTRTGGWKYLKFEEEEV